MPRSAWTGFILAAWLVMGAGCAGKPTYYTGEIHDIEGTASLAVLPPVNMSRYEGATEVVTNRLVVELLKSRRFVVVDPGVVEGILMEERLRLTDKPSLEMMRRLGEKLDVSYIAMGSINEYRFVQAGTDELPSIAISLRIVACASGKIVWASSHSRRGDDAETVFGLGRISTLEELAGVTIGDMARTLPSSSRKGK